MAAAFLEEERSDSMTVPVSASRLDLLAIIAAELPSAAAGDVTALATICHAAGMMPTPHAPRITSQGGRLLPRYEDARTALVASASKPDYIGQASAAIDAARQFALCGVMPPPGGGGPCILDAGHPVFPNGHENDVSVWWESARETVGAPQRFDGGVFR